MRIFKRNYGDFWILKCDISKYFYSINRNVLFDILSRYISDKRLLEFTHLLVFDGHSKESEVGIPIGNYTSQFFANIYLNELDCYAKHVLKCKYYVRYMDDFIILLKTKQECKEAKALIEDFISSKLKLILCICIKTYLIFSCRFYSNHIFCFFIFFFFILFHSLQPFVNF